jgi:PAS domain S-box-containing protein
MPKNLHFAVRKDRPELLSIINKGLESISEKEKEAIKQKWIAVKIEKHIDYAFMYKAIGIVLCFVLVFSLWNSHIQRQRKRLLQSEEKYRTLVEGLHEGYFFYTHDLQGVFTYISPSVSNFLGYSPSELMVNYSAILTDNTMNKDVERYTELCMQGKPQPSYMVEVFHKDGSIRWLEVSEVPIYDKRGRVVSVEGIAHDITERLKAEEGLRESEEKYRAIFENANDMIVIAQDGRIAFANSALERVLGYSNGEVVSKPFTEFIHPDDRELVFSRYKKRMSGEDVETGYQFRLLTASGQERWVIINSSALVWDKKISTLNFLTDITEQKLAEKEAMEAKELAEDANRAKSAFLANMSHELRTPLNAILGFSELMIRDTSLSAEHRSKLETIGSSGEHLLSLINDVLELSKIEAGQVVLNPENFDLYRLLSVIEEMFSLRAEDKGLTLTVERSPDVPCFVRADQGKLRQCLINIMGNAVKFTTQGRIILRVKNKGDTLFFEVEDTGIGIAPEYLDKVFSTFVQSDNGRRYKQGSGLGIPISQKFIQMMGGELTVESKVEKGSTFRFDIHVKIIDKMDVEKPVHEQRVVGLVPNQQQYRLLVVEDNENSRELLVTLLNEIGFEVRYAENGDEAVNVWKEWQPHFIWMDIRMPGMDGYEATRVIRTLPGGTKTIIVALTAHAFEEDRKKVLQSGCNDFVRKPFRESELLGIMQKYLGVRYLYENRTLHEQVEGKNYDNERMSAAVRSLPSALHKDLTDAVKSIDFDRTMALINRIQEQDKDLASRLAELLHAYRFDKLQEFLG